MTTTAIDQGKTTTQRVAALASLDRLVGTWQVSGSEDLRGIVHYEWMNDERSFLVQHVDLVQNGERSRGIELIGYHPGRQQLTSHYFGSEGEPLEYTWRVTKDTLTIWFGNETSPARYVGSFSNDANTNSGGWEWPGGGYKSSMTRQPTTA